MDKHQNIPELRFHEFKGEWKETRLEKLFSEFQSGFGITSANITEQGDYPVYGGNGLRGYTNTHTHDGFYLLIGRQGALCGNINRSYGKAYISEHAIACQANESSDTEWLAQRLDYYNLNKLSESSAQPGLSVKKLLRFKLIVPSLQEQQRIASFFTAIDQKISQLKQRKTLLEQYKKGVMQKIFSQEIRFRDINGQEFPKWEKKSLGKIAQINPTNKTLPDFFNYIDLESVEKGNLVKENFINKSDAPSRAQRVLQKNDILFQMVRPYQMNNLYFNLEGDYVASTGYAQIRTVNNPRFLYHALHLRKVVNDVNQRCTGTSYPAINSNDLSRITITLPCAQEQNKIANFVTAIDYKITNTQTQIEKAEHWKKGLLQKMFV